MSGDAHIIEIDSIVLDGVDRKRSGDLAIMIEAEVQRALRGGGVSLAAEVGAIEGRVAAEVGKAVAQSVTGGPDGV